MFPVIFEMAVLFMLWQKMNSYAQYGISTQKHMGDVLLYNFGGMKKYELSMENVFQFPVTWMLLFVMILFVTLSYPMNNLCGFGNKLLIKGKSRVKWWLSKCIWNLLCNIIFFGIIFTLILSFCSISGIQSGMQVNTDMQTVLFNLGADTSLKPDAIMPVGDIVMVFMLSVAICQIQMALGLWLKPIYSFMVMCMVLLLSAYFQSLFVIGNYAMLIRHLWINEDGIDCKVAIPAMCLIIFITVIVGVIRFKKYNIIQEEKLCKTINKSIVLEDINLDMSSGKVYGFQGINGSGKTMLMRALIGLIRPTSGKVCIDGKELGKDIDFPESIGFLLENPAFLDMYSGEDNLKLLTKVDGNVDKKSVENEIRGLIDDVGLGQAGRKKYKKYSLGMKQRLGIAAAVLGNPDIVVLDEPTNALDDDGKEMVKSVVRKQKERGALVIISCHDMQTLEELSDEIVKLKEGRICG